MKVNEKHQKDNTELMQLVSFCLGKEQFGIEILLVQEIIRMISITKMPNSPEFVEGVINLRGRIIPVIDLRARLGMERTEYTATTKILVVEITGKVVGFIVDEVSEVLRVPKSIIDVPPAAAGIDSEYITGVGKLDDRLLILLDLARVLTFEEKKELAEV